MKLRLLLSFSIWCLSFSHSAPTKTIIDGIAASIGKNPITYREAYLHRSLLEFWDDRYNSAPLETGDVLKKTVQRIAFEEMIIQEMNSLKIHIYPKTSIEKMVADRKIKNKEATLKKMLTRFGVKSKKTALDILWRTLEVDGYVKKKAEALNPITLEADIKKYYEEHKDQPGLAGKKLEDVKAVVVEMIKSESVQKSFQEWIQVLIRKYSPIYYMQS